MSRLDDIAARLQAATPGPWEVVENFSSVSVRVPDPAARLGFRLVAQVPRRHDLADADLIAHAPTDVAALLAVVRDVEKVAEYLRTTDDKTVQTSAWLALAAAFDRLETTP